MMTKRSKGGVGTNQYQVKGQPRFSRRRTQELVRQVGYALDIGPKRAIEVAPPGSKEGPWSGEARKAWYDIMRHSYDHHDPTIDAVADMANLRRDEIHEQTIQWVQQRRLSTAYLASTRAPLVSDPESKTHLYLDIALCRVPEMVYSHMDVLMPEWPMPADLQLRTYVLSHPRYPYQILRQHADDQVPEVRWVVARHPNCPDDVLDALRSDQDKRVRQAAFTNPRTPDHIRVIGALGGV